MMKKSINIEATVAWQRDGVAFTDSCYSRGHRWIFDGGIEVPASASPHIVAAPYCVKKAIDPEEAFVASLSSCHMLWFLAIAARDGYVVDDYRDEARGIMKNDHDGRTLVSEVTLFPCVTFSGPKLPSGEKFAAMHHEAHEKCYIANSVKTILRCEPLMRK